MTTREQDRILQDLSCNLMNKVGRNALDVVELCDVAKIPQHDATLAIAGTILFLAIDLMRTMMPNMTPREFGIMCEQRFSEYIARERKSQS